MNFIIIPPTIRYKLSNLRCAFPGFPTASRHCTLIIQHNFSEGATYWFSSIVALTWVGRWKLTACSSCFYHYALNIFCIVISVICFAINFVQLFHLVFSTVHIWPRNSTNIQSSPFINITASQKMDLILSLTKCLRE